MRHRSTSSHASPSPAGVLLTLLLACSESSAPAPRPEEPRPPGVIEIGGEADSSGRQAAAADSFVNAISVQTHLGNLGGIYDAGWTSIIRPRLLELGARHVRERMSTKPMVIDRFKDLANNGIRLTGGCWPNNGVLTSASHGVTAANAHGIGTVEAFDGWNEVDNTGGDWATKWIQWQTTMYALYHSDPVWQKLPVPGNPLARA